MQLCASRSVVFPSNDRAYATIKPSNITRMTSPLTRMTAAIVTAASSSTPAPVSPIIPTQHRAVAVHSATKADQTGSSKAVAATIAPYPFNNLYSEADVILQAGDGMHFYVHRSTLRVASRFFSEMFSLPQPPPSSFKLDVGSSRPELPIIPVTEDSSTLETLLRLCYPVADPDEHNTGTLAAVLGAALKYEMRVITASLIKALSAHVWGSPLYVFAVAYKCGDLFQVAGEALRAWITPPAPSNSKLSGRKSAKANWFSPSAAVTYKRYLALDDYSLELDDIPCAVYYRLLERYAAATHPSAGTSSLSQSDVDAMVKSIMSCPSGSVSGCEKQHLTERLGHPFQDSHGTDIIIRSSDYAEFYVHRSFLAFASPVFAQLLSPAPVTPPSDSADDGDNALHGVYPLPEVGQTLSRLFQLSYPMPDPELGPATVALGSALALLDAARKYAISRAVAFAKRACVAAAKDKPVELYLIASRYKWDDVARDAAMRAVYETSDRYLPEMEECTAAAYRRLLVYRQKCRDIILSGGVPTAPPRVPVGMPIEITPISDQPRNVRAPYWSTSSWLSCLGEARFWRALHEYVNDNIGLGLEGDSGETFMGDVEAMLPRSVIDDDFRASRAGTEGEQSKKDTDLLPLPSPIKGQQELRRIAHALAKVREYCHSACDLFVTCASARSNFDEVISWNGESQTIALRAVS